MAEHTTLSDSNPDGAGWALTGNTPGIQVVTDPAGIREAIAKQKAELFAIFGDRLNWVADFYPPQGE